MKTEVAAPYRQLLRNPTLMTMWGAGIVSMIGDIFFNIAIVWSVYSHSQSMFQAALVQVVWHLDSILLGPIAGTLVDRLDRKKVIVYSNLASALIVGLLALLLSFGGNPGPIVLLAFVFVLNAVNTFLAPAHYSVLPEIIGKDNLAYASGIYTTIVKVIAIVGTSLAGVAIATFGVKWAVAGDAISFLVAALCIMPLRLPYRGIREATEQKKRAPFWRELRDGFELIAKHPILRMMVLLSAFINMASFMGPLLPGLVDQQLHAGAWALGTIEAAAIMGTMIAGLFAGPLERKIGAGPMMIIGLAGAGVTVVAIAFSQWLALTVGLFGLRMIGMTVFNIANGIVIQALVPDEFRGRVWGISSSISVIAIPISSVIGGFTADYIGVSPLYVIGGLWFIGCAFFALSYPIVRQLKLSKI